MTRYFDAHNHLQDPAFEAHRDEMLATLEHSGIVRAVVNGTTEADWETVADLAARCPWVLPSFGLHPWYLEKRSPDWRADLVRRLDSGRCGLGEIGLDRWLRGLDFEDQKRVFKEQLTLAADRNLPVTIHCLKAWGSLLEIMKSQPLPACGFLLHSYSGPVEMIPQWTQLGAYFSFSGYFLVDKKIRIREAFKQIPMDRLLVETDAPAMPLPPERIRYPWPDSAKGTRVNHPANLGAIYEGLAEIQGVSLEDLATKVEANFKRWFAF